MKNNQHLHDQIMTDRPIKWLLGDGCGLLNQMVAKREKNKIIQMVGQHQ